MNEQNNYCARINEALANLRRATLELEEASYGDGRDIDIFLAVKEAVGDMKRAHDKVDAQVISKQRGE